EPGRANPRGNADHHGRLVELRGPRPVVAGAARLPAGGALRRYGALLGRSALGGAGPRLAAGPAGPVAGAGAVAERSVSTARPEDRRHRTPRHGTPCRRVPDRGPRARPVLEVRGGGCGRCLGWRPAGVRIGVLLHGSDQGHHGRRAPGRTLARPRHPPDAGGGAGRPRAAMASSCREGATGRGVLVDPFYAFVRVIARFWIWFFFERVEVRYPKRVPSAGPVLLCINHPNNLIDSLLVGSVLPRKVHYLATAALFRNPLIARFLVAVGVIPVYLKADDPHTVGRNMEMFAACHQAFDHGRLVAIYPEGVTHAEAHVQRIKTGAARIALGYEAHAPGRLTLVPVGLSFEARKRFRGRVLVSCGEPVDVSSHLAVYGEEPAKALHTLTTAIQWAMEREVVHVERIDTAAL